MYLKFKVFFLFLLSATFINAGGFPFCLYGVSDPKDIKVAKKAGFNCIQSYSNKPEVLKALAEEAARLDMQIVVYPQKIMDTPYAQEAKAWPVLAWYLVDEPDVARMPRETLAALDKTVKTAFPAHKTAFVIGQGITKIPYYDLADIVMVDWYPVPHLPLESFGRQIALARRAIGNAEKPLYGVVQAFDWKDYPQHRPDNDRIGRFPSAEEIFFMSWHAVFAGANGLFYFTFTDAKEVPITKRAPQNWAVFEKAVKEFAAFLPMLRAGEDVPPPFTVAAPALVKAWQYKQDKYIVIINPSLTPVALPEIMANNYKTLYGVKGAALIEPYGVIILRQKSKFVMQA